MGCIIIVFASLVVGAVIGQRSNGPVVATQSGLAAGSLPRINPSRGPQLTSTLNFATKDLSVLQSIDAESHLNKLQGRSTGYPVLTSISPESSTINEWHRPLLLVRTLGKSSTSSGSGASSESWSGASGGVKRKIDQQLLQHDLAWGRSKAQKELGDKAAATQNPKSLKSGSPGPSNKKPKISTKGMPDGSRETRSKSKAKSSGRSQSGSEAKGQTPGPRQRQTISRTPKSPGGNSRTDEQRARRNQRQQEIREEQKLKLKSGDPEAIRKQAETNARRVELEHERRAKSGNPILPPKSSKEERASGRAKTARYRARQRGELKPIVYKTSLEERVKSRDKMRRRRARQRGATSHAGSPPESELRSSEKSDSSKSEWKSSGRSDEPEISTSSPAPSNKQVDRGRQSSLLFDLSWPNAPTQKSQSPTRYEPLLAPTKGRKSRGEEGKSVEPQQSNQKADSYGARNNPEVTSASPQGQDKVNTNSPTRFQRPPQERLTQSRLSSPSHSLNPSLGLMQYLPPAGQQEVLSGIPRSFSPSQLQDPFLGPPRDHMLSYPAGQDFHNLLGPPIASDWPALRTTPPLSPISFSSLDLLRPDSPDPRRS
ncbi:MAG: hypothetical protein GOMPHAMPRED_001665 [Gomphillus americanus]|uniref:Uncharacterized protein n=1 Tax=Gomphillus americanus TaxID=1940652 RepID=A0A8H3FDW3_9LECA|nr:MAG: hypothetical protein GOMPHAMPRED_001665 [Gomphillus americanus]